jgi:histidine triad (HIT) family protein
MKGNCVFCAKLDEPGVKEWRGTGVHYFEPLNPVTPGHKLFIAEHTVYPHDLPALTGLLFTSASAYAGTMPMDYNLIVNGGENAGQTIKHLHVHYVPRSKNDGLKMPWTDQIKE